MANRREPLNFVDATGGLNLRSGQLQLAPNESPEMRNITLDPLGGIYTRQGWDCWNMGVSVVPEGSPWDPRRGYLTQLSDGTDIVYLAVNGKLLHATNSHDFVDSGIALTAVTHLCDFATFGDTTYFARGRTLTGYKRVGVVALAELVTSGAGNWNEDYTDPIGGHMPRAELCEAHAGYLFVANLNEDGSDQPNRLRWSHPSSQEDWSQFDYIDVGDGGSHITGLMSYEDHLLIFKSDSIWALYGYETESWQLVKVSATIGARGPQGITRSESAVFFHSTSGQGGVYAYTGERPQEISTQLRRAFEEITALDLIWVGWLGRKLWVTVPWNYAGATIDNAGAFVWDPTVGEGAWTYYNSAAGSLGPIVGGSNIDSQFRPLAVLRAGDFPCVVRLDATDDAVDMVGEVSVIGVTPWVDGEMAALMTADGSEIIASGAPGLIPFETVYRTPWLDGGWPTRKKSWRRPDFVCRRSGVAHALQIRSYRDYNEVRARRQSLLTIDGGGSNQWGDSTWNGTIWSADTEGGAEIRRGSSFGAAKALQVRIAGQTPGRRWGIDAIIFKLVQRRFI